MSEDEDFEDEEDEEDEKLNLIIEFSVEKFPQLAKRAKVDHRLKDRGRRRLGHRIRRFSLLCLQLADLQK